MHLADFCLSGSKLLGSAVAVRLIIALGGDRGNFIAVEFRGSIFLYRSWPVADGVFTWAWREKSHTTIPIIATSWAFIALGGTMTVDQ